MTSYLAVGKTAANDVIWKSENIFLELLNDLETLVSLTEKKILDKLFLASKMLEKKKATRKRYLRVSLS